MNIKFKEIIKKIKTANSIAVFTHSSPDPDGVGSLLSLCLLKKYFKNKIIDGYVEEKITCFKDFDQIDNYFDVNLKQKYDLIICVDIATKSKLGKYESYILSHDNVIVIDHHSSRDEFGNLIYVDNKASSNCEIMYDIFNAMKLKIDFSLAEVLYSGIVADTGLFKFSNVTPKTHYIAGELIKLLPNFSSINNRIISDITFDEFKIMKLVLKNTTYKSGLGISIVTNEELIENKIKNIKSNNLANLILSVENTKIAVLILEKDKNEFHTSLRSIPGYDVSKIASAFGGGGHTCASGCKYEDKNIKNYIAKLTKEIRKYL